jgi:hypothetical protein
MSQTEGRIKCVANVTHPTASLADVTTYMQETLDSLATNRVLSKMRTDFQNDFVATSKMKIIELPDGWQLYPKIAWAGTLKANPPRDLDAILNETVQDLATLWQADLTTRGYTITKWYVKSY